MFTEVYIPTHFTKIPSLHIKTYEDEEDEDLDTTDFEDDDFNEDINDDQKFKDEYDLIAEGTDNEEEEEDNYDEDSHIGEEDDYGDGREQ